MLIKDIKLTNYRNHLNSYYEFIPTLNIIVGNNGTGKTNILEAISVVSNTKSFKKCLDSSLINNNSEYLRIILNSDSYGFKVVINNDSKHLFINDKPISKSLDYLGKINSIIFKPDDLQLFIDTPKQRRKDIDIEIAKVDKKYASSLVIYSNLLKDKNKLLKEFDPNKDLLEIIESSMVPQIKTIISCREEYFKFINERITNIYKSISNHNDEIKIIYEKCSDIDNIENNIYNSLENDLKYGYVTYGPHHDDYYFMFNNNPLTEVASQGQKRMVLIAYRLALKEFIVKKTGSVPIILLDDILSELDKDNQNRLLNNLPDSQIIITTTDINKININNKYKLIELEGE